MDWDFWGMIKEMNGGRWRRLEGCKKRLIEARTALMSGRLGNGWILEWKPFLVGFRLKFDGVVDVGIARRVKKYLLHKMHSRLG